MSIEDIQQTLDNPNLTHDELKQLIEDYLVHLEVIGTIPSRKTVGFGLLRQTFYFSDTSWKMFKRLRRITWDKIGEFKLRPTLDVGGGRNYIFDVSVPPFTFTRSNGEIIVPSRMVTDGGSIPRVAWVIPGLDPWGCMPAFIIHDWEFMAHHCLPGYKKEFEDVNDTLAEAIYTMMMTQTIEEDWKLIVVIHTAVNSFIGRRVWDKPWTQEQCDACLSPP